MINFELINFELIDRIQDILTIPFMIYMIWALEVIRRKQK